MVLEVRANSREVDYHGDVGRLEEDLGADATGLKDLWRMDGTCCHDNFLPGTDD